MTAPAPVLPPSSMAAAALDHLKRLIRIDTRNPPGDERPAAEYLAAALTGAGLVPQLFERRPRRTNLVVRLAGQGSARPLLLTSHLDTVPFGDGCRHPPLSGEQADGFIWGRGAIDMKNMAAMSTAVVCRLAAERERAPLARDVIFAAVADEETGCALGSRFLVEEHAEEVEAEYMLGEVGGFSQYFGDAQVFPVQVATKGLLWMRASAVGTSGHGSIPSDDNPVVHLARALARLGSVRLPQHLTPVTREFITRVARLQPPVKRAILRLLLRPRFSPFILDRLFPDRTMARSIDAGLRNTVNPTQLEAGLAPNVIPTTASAVLDGRYLPGQTPADLIAEIRRVVGDQIAIEVMTELPAQETHPIDSPLLESIEAVIGERFPQAKVVPYLCPGFTDAAYFARLGARAYGFTPVLFEPQHDIRFADLFHGVDERIPVDGFRWGVEVLYDVIRHFAAGR